MIFLTPLLLAPIFYFAFSSLWQFGFFCAGIALGIILMWVDQTIAYKYYAEPGQPVQLITRSPLFFVSYLLVTIFVVTSSGSPLGIGLVLTIGVTLATELYKWRNNPQVLNGRFYVQAKKQLSPAEFRWVFRGLLLFLTLMTIITYV